MSNIPKYFMWGYQQHTRINFKCSAEELFNKLDKNLNPEVFFIGVLKTNREDRYPVCFEPEDIPYDINKFSDIEVLAENLRKVDGDNNTFHSHPIAQENHDKRIHIKSYISAIQSILESNDYLNKKKFFIACSTEIDDFMVFTVLTLEESVLNNHYQLRKSFVDNRYTIHKSLIDSSVSVFLKECSKSLLEGGHCNIDRNADEMLRESANLFMHTPAWVGRKIEGLYNLYETCNQIASLKYENGIGIGSILIAQQNHKNIKLELQFEKPICISNYRKVRKILELSNENLSIICDSYHIFGLGHFIGVYNPNDESLFEIKFNNHFQWSLLHDGNSLMVVEYREPSLPKEIINQDKFTSDLSRVFTDVTRENLDFLWEVAIEATKQKHGAMIVVCDNTETEAKRLSSQCMVIKPIKLTNDLISQCTAIDGALLIDTNGICYAIGLILDGIATDKGDSSRGSRYNSAVRYHEHFKADFAIAIIVVSEDGMINQIPFLRQQIKHSLIIEIINKFKDILEKEDFDRKTFSKSMIFFENNEFYLIQEECNQINEFRKEIESKFEETLKESIYFSYSNLKPNKEMNDSYYLDK